MTSDQYTELVGYLGRKFEGVDRRFEEARLEREEIRRHSTVLFDRAQTNLKAVAEGLGLRIDRVDGRLERVEGAVVDLSANVRDGFADHERRIRVLEGAESEGSTGG